MKKRKWTNKKFITAHPSGNLATALIQVKEIMAKGKRDTINFCKQNYTICCRRNV